MSLKPSSNEEHIGIEIECLGIISRSELRAILYTDRILRGKVHVGYDLSIRREHSKQKRHEVRICCPIKDRKKYIKRVTKLLIKHGCTVNESCSIHYHLDMRVNSVVRKNVIFFNLVKCMESMFNLQPSYRRKSKYCVPNKYPTYTQTVIHERGDNDRRRAVNAHAFSKLGTLEVRVHEGTLDADTIINFSNYLVKIKSKRMKLKKVVETIEDIKKYVTKDRRLLSSLRQRMEEVNEAQ